MNWNFSGFFRTKDILPIERPAYQMQVLDWSVGGVLEGGLRSHVDAAAKSACIVPINQACDSLANKMEKGKAILSLGRGKEELAFLSYHHEPTSVKKCLFRTDSGPFGKQVCAD